MPNPALADHAFWRFSLDRYGRPGVAEACLALQDRRGADVNVVLLLLWQAEQGRGLAESDLSAVLAAARDWQAQVVGPVRAARRAAKRAAAAGEAAAAIYPRLKEAELACEHAEQTALAALVPAEAAGPPDRRAAELALRAYLATLPGGPAAEEEDWLAVLVQAVSPAASHPR